MRSSKPLARLCAWAFLGLAACQSTDADEEGIYQGVVGETEEWEAVMDKEWRLESIDQKPIVTGSTVTLWLRGDSLNGNAGANQYSAEFQRIDQDLSIGAIAATRMFHDDPPGTMAQEGEYLSVLGKIGSYRLVDGALQLREGGRVRLVFRRP